MDAVIPKTLTTSVFDVIAQRFRSRADEIAGFARTRYSFEEWLNWEAFAACSENPAWQVKPKPSYCDLGISDCKDYGDLLVGTGETKVLVEVGLVHDGTGGTWPAKLAKDVQKLARPLTGVSALHMIVVASASDIETLKGWGRWLGKVACWGRQTNLAMSVQLPPGGTMLIRGWD